MESENGSRGQAPSITEYLSAARWKHALFTTYVLSLSYFESEVLRPLLQQGCDDVWLVCDARGYRSSLLERRSMRVGQEYRIVPVALPNGVFHPKCIHLVSDVEQVLLVGSGNVTFGGHGRNTEIFEALVPNQHATAFSDFSYFLESLGSRPDVRIPRREWIDDFAGRAARAAATGEDRTTHPLRLIHPVEKTAIAQLREVAAPLGECEQAKVISPYHDPHGNAVRDLLDAVNAKSVAVAVTAEESSPFPFADARGWKCRVFPGRPKFEDKRFVHAKWIECDFADEKLVLSGSFNATSKALSTTDNVELGVLRRAPIRQTFIEWEECKAPPFERADSMPSGLGKTEIVYASFDRNDSQKLTGQIISLQEVVGSWDFRVVQADGTTLAGTVDVQADGHFAIVDPKLEPFTERPALQILFRTEGREARGWIHNEMLLGVGARRRLTAGALSRLMRREGSDDDVQALLDYLSVAAHKHLRVFDLPVLSNVRDHEGADDSSVADTVRVSIKDLAPMEGLPDSAEGMLPASTLADDPFATALVKLRRMLLGHGSARKAASQGGSAFAMLAEDEEDESRKQTPERVSYNLGLCDFESAFIGMIEDCDAHPDRMNGLLTIQFEIGMWMRIHRVKDIDGAFEFLGSWLSRTAERTTHPQDQITALSQHFVTATAIRAVFAPSDKKTEELVGLHDDLERFFGGAVDRSAVLASLIDDPGTGFAAALARNQTSIDLQEALRGVLTTRTRRQQLIEALDARARDQTVPGDWAIFQSVTGRALHASMHRPNWQQRVKKALPNYDSCGHCYCNYPLDEKAIFKRERIGHCAQCRKFSLDVSP